MSAPEDPSIAAVPVALTGRPTKFSAEVGQRIVDAVREGHYLTHAAAIAGVHRSTVHDWLTRGEAWPIAVGDEDLADWAMRYREAEALAIGDALADIKARKKRWQARAFWVERRDPEHYGRRQVLEHTGANGGPMQHQHSGVVMMPAFGASDGTTFPDPEPKPVPGAKP